jgi:hypothetical protein
VLENEQRDEVRRLLLSSASAAEALGQIFQLKKTSNKHLSYAYIASKTGQKSRGYVGDLVNGKRQVPLKLAAPLAQALALEPAAQEFFVALVSKEHAADDAESKYWQTEIEKLKKLFKMHKALASDLTFSNLFFTFELFCAMSLFRDGCTYKKLLEHFGRDNEHAVKAALTQLYEMGAIAEENKILVQKIKHLNLISRNRLVDLLGFLREGLSETSRVLYKWFQRPKETFFDATIISVKRSEYERKLPQLIKEIQKVKTELENDEADQLIRFNVQIYPLRHKD